MILQHGRDIDDYLLAHEFCVVALSKGERRANWLSGATEDRFLMSVGRPQRFATQFKAEKGVYKLYETDPHVTDN